MASACSPVSPMRLTAAPRHLAMCRYTSQGGQPDEALSPAQCVAALQKALAEGKAPPEIVVSGPGDPLAEARRTLDLLEAVRGVAPGVPVRLVTAGLGLAAVADELRDLGVGLVTVQVNAVSAEMAQALYAWVRPGVLTLRAAEAAEALLAGQREAIKALRDADVAAEVEFLLVPGVNAAHVAEVAAWAAGFGAQGLSVLPARSAAVPHTGNPREPGDAEMLAAVAAAQEFLPAMDGRSCMALEETGLDDSALYDATKPYVAVATSDGVNVDAHLGKAERLLVYEIRQGEVALAGSRPGPPKGGGEARWQTLARTLADCRALIAASAGENPRQALLEHGLPVVTGSSTVEEAVARVFGVAPNMGIVRGR